VLLLAFWVIFSIGLSALYPIGDSTANSVAAIQKNEQGTGRLSLDFARIIRIYRS